MRTSPKDQRDIRAAVADAMRLGKTIDEIRQLAHKRRKDPETERMVPLEPRLFGLRAERIDAVRRDIRREWADELRDQSLEARAEYLARLRFGSQRALGKGQLSAFAAIERIFGQAAGLLRPEVSVLAIDARRGAIADMVAAMSEQELLEEGQAPAPLPRGEVVVVGREPRHAGGAVGEEAQPEREHRGGARPAHRAPEEPPPAPPRPHLVPALIEHVAAAGRAHGVAIKVR